MHKRFSDFDREFAGTKRSIKRWQGLTAVISIAMSLAILAFIAVLIYAIGHFAGLW
jgi:hypothetical protein